MAWSWTLNLLNSFGEFPSFLRGPNVEKYYSTKKKLLNINYAFQKIGMNHINDTQLIIHNLGMRECSAMKLLANKLAEKLTFSRCCRGLNNSIWIECTTNPFASFASQSR